MAARTEQKPDKPTWYCPATYCEAQAEPGLCKIGESRSLNDGVDGRSFVPACTGALLSPKLFAHRIVGSEHMLVRTFWGRGRVRGLNGSQRERQQE
jgi:hypothetical protein